MYPDLIMAVLAFATLGPATVFVCFGARRAEARERAQGQRSRC